MADDTTTTTTSTDNAKVITNKDITVNNNDPNAKLLEPTWVNQWKEVLAYVFSTVIFFDFIVAPCLVMFIDAYYKLTMPPWAPLTLQGGGLFYIGVSAILSVGAYGNMVSQRELIKNLPSSSSS